MQQPEVDSQAAHRHFSASCFNGVWELLDKDGRTSEEDEEMVRLCQASIWHWTQRDDCSSRSLSIGYWQLSRVYSVLRQADSARHYAQLSLDHSRDEPAFYLGYAYEALARAESVAGNTEKAARHLDDARKLATKVEDAGERKTLEDDLDSIK